MPQPMGPQARAGAAEGAASALRAAAGLDITFSTFRPWQEGHRTSASSERRMMNSSKTRSQALQAYS